MQEEKVGKGILSTMEKPENARNEDWKFETHGNAIRA